MTPHRDVILEGGTIWDTTINLVDGSMISPDQTAGSTLQSVRVNGDIVLGTSGWLQILGGLSLNGTVTLSTNGNLLFGDSQTMTNGMILFAGHGASVLIQSGAVTWGPGVVVQGTDGIITAAVR